MRRGFLFLAGLGLLAGCSYEVPSFLGREGNSDGSYVWGGDTPTPSDPVSIPLRTAVAESALRGVTLRAVAIAPTQGYFGPTLTPLDAGRPDERGILTFDFTAVPPVTPQPVGTERSRTLDAAVFFTTDALRHVTGFRVKGGATTQSLSLPAAPR